MNSFYNEKWDRPYLTPSIAKILIGKTPTHARAHCPFYGVEDKPAATAAMNEGTIVDQILLGGSADIVLIDAPDYRTKAAKEQRDEALACGQIPVLVDAYDRLARAAEEVMIKSTPFVREAIEGGDIKTRIFWESNGIACSTEPDIIYHDAVIDLKHTRICPTADAWRRHVSSMGYHIQAYAHLEATGSDRFGWLVVEALPPHSVVVHWASPALLAIGQRDWQAACRLWKACIDTGDFWGPQTGDIDPEDWLAGDPHQIEFTEDAE